MAPGFVIFFVLMSCAFLVLWVVDVYLDSRKLALEPGQAVIAHGTDRGLDPDEVRQRSVAADHRGHVPGRGNRSDQERP